MLGRPSYSMCSGACPMKSGPAAVQRLLHAFHGSRFETRHRHECHVGMRKHDNTGNAGYWGDAGNWSKTMRACRGDQTSETCLQAWSPGDPAPCRRRCPRRRPHAAGSGGMPQARWGRAAPAGLRAGQSRWAGAGHHGLRGRRPQRGSAGPAGQTRAGPGTGQPYLWTRHPPARAPQSGLRAPAARRPHAWAGACSAAPAACAAARRLAAMLAHSPQTAHPQIRSVTWLQQCTPACFFILARILCYMHSSFLHWQQIFPLPHCMWLAVRQTL